MTSSCTTRDPSAYESGRLAHGDARLFRPGGLELTARAIALASLDAGARILDLGSGAGDTVRYLLARQFEAIGIDCAVDSAAAAVDGPAADTRIVAPAEALPFASGTFHAVVAECSFSLFEDRNRALTECARVLVDSGRLIISDLYALHPEAVAALRALPASCAAGILVREELELSLLNSGFALDLWEDHSRALRECAARFLFEYGSLDDLWNCADGESSQAVQSAMRAARAGYFLLIATKRRTAAEGRAKP